MTSKLRCSTNSLSLILAVLAAVVLLGAPQTSQAQPGSDDNVENYEELVKQGEELFKAEEWAEARAKFEKAYGVHPVPLLLFNIASTYRREGSKEEALDYYKKYLEVAPPDADYRGVAQEAVVNIEEQIAAEKAASETTPVVGTQPSGSSKVLRYSGLGLGLVGVASLSFGIYRGLEARELNDKFEALDEGEEWTQELQDDFERGESLEQQAIIFSIVGGVAIAAGGALYVAGMLGDTPNEREIAVTPIAGGDTTGFAVSGRF